MVLLRTPLQPAHRARRVAREQLLVLGVQGAGGGRPLVGYIGVCRRRAAAVRLGRLGRRACGLGVAPLATP